MDKTIGWNENDTDMIDPVVRPLKRAGHQFIRLHTMREALDAMDTMRQADLILLDTTLPPADTPYDTDEETALPSCIFCISYARCPDFKTPVVVLTDLRCPQLKRAL